MIEITFTRWSAARTFVEIKSLGVPIYVKEYPFDVAESPEVGVDLMNFVKSNDIPLSVPVIMKDYRTFGKERERTLSLEEISEFTKDYISHKGH